MKAQFLNLQAALNQKPASYAEILREFKAALSVHDFYYDFSDDQTVWLSGQKEHNLLRETVRQHEGLQETYSLYMKEKEAK